MGGGGGCKVRKNNEKRLNRMQAGEVREGARGFLDRLVWETLKKTGRKEREKERERKKKRETERDSKR